MRVWCTPKGSSLHSTHLAPQVIHYNDITCGALMDSFNFSTFWRAEDLAIAARVLEHVNKYVHVEVGNYWEIPAGLELQIMRHSHFKTCTSSPDATACIRECLGIKGHQGQVRGHQRTWPWWL